MNKNNLKKESDKLVAQWKKEKEEISHLKELKNKLDSLNFNLGQSYNAGDFKKASEIQYKEIPQVQAQIDANEKDEKSGKKLLSDEITEENIAEIVAKMTNIPVSRISRKSYEPC